MNIVTELKALYVDVIDLIRVEGQLIRAEAGEKLAQVQSGLILVLSGMLFLLIAAIVLVQSAIDWVATITGDALATLIVGSVAAICGLILFLAGHSRLRPANLKPHRSLAAARRSADIIRDEA